MERIDELNTKVRTTGYDNDRLRSMHQNAVEAAGNAEREMNVWKSRASCVSLPPPYFCTSVGVHSLPPIFLFFSFALPGRPRKWRKTRRRGSKP